MGTIFISYARAQREYAEKLDQDLQKRGFETWRDLRDLDPFQDFTGEIENAIHAASAIVVCLTEDVKKRGNSFVRREIAYALQRGIRVLPVVFPGGELPVHLSTWTAVFVKDQYDYSRAFEEIIEILRRPREKVQYFEYYDPPHLVTYLNNLITFTSTSLQRSVYKLLNLMAIDAPEAIAASSASSLVFTFNFKVSPAIAGEIAENVFEKSEPASEPTDAKSFSSLEEAFVHHNGRMLLLGEAGAGKTTVLLAFARDAAARRLLDPSAPIPILINVSKWKRDYSTFISWIRDEIGFAMQSKEKIVYILDGLDEINNQPKGSENLVIDISQDARTVFLEQLYTHLDENKLFVLSSRINDYNEMGYKIHDAGAIKLQPLSLSQIEKFLITRHQTNLYNAIIRDKDLTKMASTPLLLTLLSTAFESEVEANKINFADLREVQILEFYVKRRFLHESMKKDNPEYDFETTMLFLGKLAARMLRASNGLWNSNQTSISYLSAKGILHSDTDRFVEFAIALHMLQQTYNDDLQFSHNKLRDYFASNQIISSLLNDKEGHIQESAAARLGAIGYSNAIPALTSLINDTRIILRQKIIRALGDIRDKQAIPSLVESLHDSHTSEEAGRSLGKIGVDALPHLIDALEDPQLFVRLNAITALGLIRDESTLPYLSKLMTDPENEVQKFAIKSLCMLGDVGLIYLIDRYKLTNKQSRMLIIDEFRKREGFGRIDKLVLLFADALQDIDNDVQIHAIDSVGKIGLFQLLPLLHNFLLDNNREVVRRTIRALGQVGNKESVPFLEDLLKSKDRTIQYEVVVALGQISDNSAVTVLVNLINEMKTNPTSTEVYTDLSGGSSVLDYLDSIMSYRNATEDNLITAIINSLKEIGTKEAIMALDNWTRKEDKTSLN